MRLFGNILLLIVTAATMWLLIRTFADGIVRKHTNEEGRDSDA